MDARGNEIKSIPARGLSISGQESGLFAIFAGGLRDVCKESLLQLFCLFSGVFTGVKHDRS